MNLQIIIVDDKSEDGTEALIKKGMIDLDKRIEYIKHERNRGLAAGRNTALRNAKGKYFTFIDDDDMWEKNFVKEFVKIASNYNSDWFFVCGNKYRTKKTYVNKYPDYEGKLKEIIIKGYTPPVASQFYFTESLRKINGYNEKVLSGVDHDLWIRLVEDKMSVKSIRLPLAVPNDNFIIKRMTGDKKIRLRKIEKSLLIWKNIIEKNFGEEFYKHFCKEYNIYIQYCACYKEFISKNYIEAVWNFVNSPFKKHILKNIWKIIIDKYKNKNATMLRDKPLFKPYLYNAHSRQINKI